MNVPFISQFRRFVGSIFHSGSSLRTNVFGIGAQEVYSPIEQETAISKGFNANTAVYSIVKKYAKKCASIDVYIENKKTEDPYEDSHPLMVLLKRPNERQAHSVFFKLVFSGYKLFGEAFIWLNRGDVTQMVNEFGELEDRSSEQYLSQPVLEMYTIPANHIVIVTDPNDPFSVSHYHLRNRPDVKFRKEDIIHWMDVNLDWDEFSHPQLRGMTPLKPGSKTLAADNSLVESMMRMAQNDGAKGALVNKTLGAKISPEQRTQVQNVIDTRVNNKEVKNAIAAFEGDWQYLDFGMSAVDMNTLEMREFIYKELCFLFDVPYGFFDSHTPYAEKQLAARDWISNSIEPDCKELNGEMQRVLFKAFKLSDQEAEICSNFDGLPEMQEDKAKQADWLMKVWPIVPNEVREALGYDRLEDPQYDEPWLSSSIQPVSTMGESEADAIMQDMEMQRIQSEIDANNGGNRAKDKGKVS